VIHADVRAIWPSWNVQFEGYRARPYLDARKPPLRTVGIGCAITSLGEWCGLPWTTVDGHAADASVVMSEWYRLGELEGGHGDAFYASRIYLTDEAVHALAWKRYDAIASAIAGRWPASATWPGPAWQGACSMGYALGVGDARPGLLSPEWPRLHAAFEAQHWGSAAVECIMRGPGLDRRNVANARLFWAAEAQARQ